MDIKKLQKLVVDALEDVKAQDIQVFDTTHLTSMFDRIAVASGTSNRQTKALAASVRDKVKAAGGNIVSIEGENTGEWVLVDLGDMIVHVMQPTIRAYYRLEELWGDKPISLVSVKRKTKQPTFEPPVVKAAAKRTAKSAASKTAETGSPKKSAPRKTASKAAESKTTVTKSPAKKAVSTKKPAATKSASTTKTPAKAPAKKVSTKSKTEK